MRMVSGTREDVSIPETVYEWEIYDKPGAKVAAERLTKALVKALQVPSREDAILIMQKALELDRLFGSSDTEPRALAEKALTQGRGGDYWWTL